MPETAPVPLPQDPTPGSPRGPRRKGPAAAAAPIRPVVEDVARQAFLRSISHELRTPLNAVIGFSEILADELYGPLGAPQYKEYAEIVRQSGHKLLKLVNQTVEMVRLESGAADLAARAEPLEPALRSVLAGLQAQADAKALFWQVEGTADLPSLMVDARGLRTMLDGLLQNALNRSPAEGVVSVAARSLSTRVVIEITDEGGACSAADLPRLLRPFELMDPALAGKTEGVGLGVPLSRLMAEASGGTLRLRSTDGGLTAALSLPRA
jgi:signal transduction histidine kinase